MKKILYLMHLPWGWIKQRPHFIAEGLTGHYSVDAVYRFYRVPFEGKLVRNVSLPGLSLTPLVILPFNRLAPVAAINAWILRLYLKGKIGGYDVVWISHPEMYEAVAQIIPAGAQVVYDCMDNHPAFDLARRNPSWSRRMLAAEGKLLERSDTIFASSESLKKTLMERYGLNKEINVVNNGIHLEDEGAGQVLPPAVGAALASPHMKLVYIGTVASWLDVELLVKTVERHRGVVILLIGPCEISLPAHERILHLGPVVHRQIYTVMDKADALIMPFTVNELVLGVDPVKLYEYVYSCKPAIAVRYPESERFGDYVHLYRGMDEYLSLVDRLVRGELGAKKNQSDCVAFARSNTWEERVKKIVLNIEGAGERVPE